ncbi:imidazolonepropionase-like domain-containing protein [Streptomyces roseoviridis]|uniref:Aminodeoxyfutalosine deaminase/Imidazolonepropionase-like composite domain-containing protein n=1 Tax=Streptomyces roseoviridis TaxID=67361 RepID=A0ABV5QJ54_9ACTN
MLTLHAADASPETSVLVDGARIAAVGPYEELAAAHPGARARRWPGLLLPGLLNPYGPELLEQTYHPDPREADAYGTEPVTGERARALFRADPARLGASARRGVQRLLAHGTVAVAGELRSRAAQDAVRRAGLAIGRRPDGLPGPPSLSPVPLVLLPRLTVGAPARFAVFDVPDTATLVRRGAGTCVATVLGGRLVYRAR